MNDEHEARYVLSERGMRFLAERAGVSVAAFRKRAGVVGFSVEHGESPEDAVRFIEHTIGINRFIAQLAADARQRGWRLVEARNESESVRVFDAGDGRRSWIKPDGSGVLDIDGEPFWFLLEYDRGTLDRRNYRAKFRGYRRYHRARAWETDLPREPVLLFVCADDRAERRVIEAVRAAETGGPTFVTTDWRWQTSGTLGEIWTSDGSERRHLAAGVGFGGRHVR